MQLGEGGLSDGVQVLEPQYGVLQEVRLQGQWQVLEQCHTTSRCCKAGCRCPGAADLGT